MNLIKLLLFFLCLMTTVQAQAQELIPGSYRLEYGGLYKIIVSQGSSFLRGHWLDNEELHYDNGDINFAEYTRRRQEINLHLHEWKDGLPWYYRRWWHSLPEEKGGAPEEKKIIKVGTTYTIVDLKLFYFTNALELKWRGLEASVDFSKNSPITIGIGTSVPLPHTGWKFRVYPTVNISSMKLITNPLESVRRIGVNLGVTWAVGGNPLIALIANCWFSFERSEWFFGLQAKLLQW